MACSVGHISLVESSLRLRSAVRKHDVFAVGLWHLLCLLLLLISGGDTGLGGQCQVLGKGSAV